MFLSVCMFAMGGFFVLMIAKAASGSTKMPSSYVVAALAGAFAVVCLMAGLALW